MTQQQHALFTLKVHKKSHYLSAQLDESQLIIHVNNTKI